MKRTIRLTEGQLTQIIEKTILNEIYSDIDMKRGEDLSKTHFGVDFKFTGDFRKDKLIIKKLVRLKSKTNNVIFKQEIDNILDLIENK